MQEQIDTSKLQLASIGSRFIAFVIDELILSLILITIYWSSIAKTGGTFLEISVLMQTTLFLPYIFLRVVYHTFFVWYYGATAGKMIVKIRVIDANHWGNVNLFSSFLRAVGRVLSELFFYAGFIISFFNDGKKTLHDIIGRTLVVNA